MCVDVTELSGAVSGSVDYSTSGVYAPNMNCLWRIHAPADMVNALVFFSGFIWSLISELLRFTILYKLFYVYAPGQNVASKTVVSEIHFPTI